MIYRRTTHIISMRWFALILGMILLVSAVYAYGIRIVNKDLEISGGDLNVYGGGMICLSGECLLSWTTAPLQIVSNTLGLSYLEQNGLGVSGGALYVKAGTGLGYDASGNLQVLYGSTAGTAVEGNTQISINAGTGLSGGGTITLGAGGSVTIVHADTSSATTVSNTGGVVIQSIGVDTFGHVTEINSVDLDTRYVPLSRQINTVAPLTGGGALSTDLTLGINIGTGLKVNVDTLEMNITTDLSCPPGQALTLVNPATGTYACAPLNPPDNVTGTGDVNYIPYWTGSQTLGSTNIYYDSVNGRVGIGVSVPQATLDVNGVIIARDRIYSLSDPGYAPAAELRTWGINKPDGHLYIEWGVDAGDALYITDHWRYTSPVYIRAGPVYIQPGNQTVMYVGNGNVGIGTTSPTEKLHVEGNAYASGYLKAGTGICIGSDCRTSLGVADVTGTAPITVTGTTTKNVALDYNTDYFTLDAANKLALTSAYAIGSAYDSRFVNEGQANSITSTMIVDGAVGTADLADNAVTSAKILDGTIQIADINTTQFDARYINEGQAAGGDLSGTYPNPTVSGLAGYTLPTLSTTPGALYWNGSAWVLQTVDTNTSDDVTGSGSAGQVAFWTGTQTLGGSANLYWDNVNSRLGIGTTPSYPLDVSGTVRASSFRTTAGAVEVLRRVAGTADFLICSQDGTGRVQFYWNVPSCGTSPTYQTTGEPAAKILWHPFSGTGFVLYYAPAGTAGNAITWQERFRVDLADNYVYVPGNLGVGVSSPTYKLQVSGDIYASGTIYEAGQSLSSRYIDEGQAAGGDLSDTYPNPTVSGLKGYTLPALSTGALYWNGTAWTFQTVDTDPTDDLTTSTLFDGDVNGPYNNLQLKPGVVTSTEIADGTITNADIASGTVFVTAGDGTTTFNVTNSNRTLTISAGTGISVSVDTLNHKITITNTGDTDPTDDVTGSGTFPYIPYWTGGKTLGTTIIYYDEVNRRIGIGTTIPGYTLDVNGDVHASNATIDNKLTVYQISADGISATSIYAISILQAGDLVFKNNFRVVEDGDNALLILNPEGTPIMRIDANGNLWIRGRIYVAAGDSLSKG